MPGDRSHTLAAAVLCGLATLVMIQLDVSITNIIYINAMFMFVTIYGDIPKWRPYIDRAPKLAELSMNIITGPIILCLIITLILGISIWFLMTFWVPLVEPVIDSTKDTMEQIATGNITTSTWIALAAIYTVGYVSQLFRIIRLKLIGRG